MDDDRSTHSLDDETLGFVRFKARQIAGRYGFHRDEFEDVQQTLIAHCLERMARFDSRRGSPHTFASIVINRGIATIIESQKARCRDYRLCQSFDSLPDLGKSIAEGEDYSRLASYSRSFEQTFLTLDVQRTVAVLPPELRRICHLLMVIDRLAGVAKAAGVSRATLHRRMRSIRAAFVQARLSDYFPRVTARSVEATAEIDNQRTQPAAGRSSRGS